MSYFFSYSLYVFLKASIVADGVEPFPAARRGNGIIKIFQSAIHTVLVCYRFKRTVGKLHATISPYVYGDAEKLFTAYAEKIETDDDLLATVTIKKVNPNYDYR